MAEKVRQILRLSIICFFILAIMFFLMIFLIGLSKKHVLKNSVDEKVPIQQNEQATWGQIPGTLGYDWTRSYSLYEFNYQVTAGSPIISLASVGTYEYNVTRDYDNAFWYAQKSVVDYNASYTLTEITASEKNEEDAAADTVSTINMAGYSVWHQMVNKPKYFKAWQAMTQAYELMLNSNYMERLYAYNSLEYFFNNFSDVQTYVLAGMTE